MRFQRLAQTRLLAGSDGHVLGVLREAYLRVPSRNPSLENCGRGGEGGGVRDSVKAGLDVGLFQVVGIGLTICEGVGVVKRVRTLVGGVHRLATAFKEVEVWEEVKEMKDEWDEEEEWRIEGRRKTLINDAHK